MDQWVRDLRFVAIDLETTGLNPYKHEIIEIGAVAFNLDDLGEDFSILIKPEKKMDPKARAVHQISAEELESHAVPLAELLEPLLEAGAVTVCSQCAARRDLGVDDLRPGVVIRGSAAFVEEVMAPGTRTLVY